MILDLNDLVVPMMCQPLIQSQKSYLFYIVLYIYLKTCISNKDGGCNLYAQDAQKMDVCFRKVDDMKNSRSFLQWEIKVVKASSSSQSLFNVVFLGGQFSLSCEGQDVCDCEVVLGGGWEQLDHLSSASVDSRCIYLSYYCIQMIKKHRAAHFCIQALLSLQTLVRLFLL